MSVRFTQHCLQRIRERFTEASDRHRLLRLIESKLSQCDPAFGRDRRAVIDGTCNFRPVRAVVQRDTPSTFVVVSVMWK